MKLRMFFLAQADGGLATVLAFQVLAILGLAAGIAKCWSISRRPTTNTKCVMALMLLLVACLIPVVSRTLSVIVPIPLPSIIILFSFAMILASAVLAAVGLRECSQRRYAQGKAQAIWTLSLSLIVAVSPLLFLAQLRWNFPGTADVPLSGRVFVYEDLNFKFIAPGPWQETGSDPLHLKPALVLRRTGSEVHFAVVAQPVPNQNYSTEDLAVTATNHLSKVLESLRVGYRGPFRIDRAEGVQLDIEGGHLGQTLYLENRLFERNGRTYQLLTWGPKRDEIIVMEQAKALAWRFELLDYTKPSEMSATLRAIEASSPEKNRLTP